MIVIFSDKDDFSTTKVMEYLRYWGEEVLRVNREDTINASYNIIIGNETASEFSIQINNKLLRLENIKSIWFRRGGFYFKKVKKEDIIKDKEKLYDQMNAYFSAEQTTLNRYIYETLQSSKIRILGNPFVFNAPKLSILKIARSCGLRIPETLIASEKAIVQSFLKKRGAIITKAIQDNFTPLTSTQGYGSLTEEIEATDFEKLPNIFFPSLFQEKLEKKYEIRIFFIDGEFFSIAIFSQENVKTSIDFRNYDYEKPNRKTIIDLPAKVKNPLRKVLKKMDLNTASIDMIYTKDDHYVFLEINPVGQYDMVGRLMNFNLDKKIAKWLAIK